MKSTGGPDGVCVLETVMMDVGLCRPARQMVSGQIAEESNSQIIKLDFNCCNNQEIPQTFLSASSHKLCRDDSL